MLVIVCVLFVGLCMCYCVVGKCVSSLCCWVCSVGECSVLLRMCNLLLCVFYCVCYCVSMLVKVFSVLGLLLCSECEE